MRRQRGISLIGFVLIAGLGVFVLLVGMKTAPAIMEYFTIKKNVNAVLQSGDARGASVADIRRAYDRRAQIDDTSHVAGADLDVSKEQGEVVIGFSYSRKVPLFGNVSLCLDFDYSTSPTKQREVP
jgi:hypothetical protein